jgi:hypothetical protein
VGRNHQHPVLLGVVLDQGGNSRSQPTRPGSGCFSKASGQARSPTGLLGRVSRGTRRPACLPRPDKAAKLSGLAAQPCLTDRTEAERAFALAEYLGRVNAAAEELGTTWPSLRKAFTHYGPGMPARNPEAVRQRAIDAAYQRSGRPAASAGSGVCGPQSRCLPARQGPATELHEWIRRDEQYAILGANVVVELNSESRARQPTRAWAIIRRVDRSHRLADQPPFVLTAATPTAPAVGTASVDLPALGMLSDGR